MNDGGSIRTDRDDGGLIRRRFNSQRKYCHGIREGAGRKRADVDERGGREARRRVETRRAPTDKR